MTQSVQTFPRLLLQHAQGRPNRPAYREKYLGIWQTNTWAETAEQVRALACGLAAVGFKRGMNLAIVGDNRPRLYWAMAAAQVLGGIPVPLYQDAVANEMVFVLENAEIDFAIVEDQEQVDKFLEIQDGVGEGDKKQSHRVAHIIYEDGRGLRQYTDDNLMSYEGLQALGRDFDKQHPQFYQEQIDLGQPDDTAIILYTSGTTGKPKGVCHSHRGMILAAQHGTQFDHVTDKDDVLSYLPMAWVGDFLFSYAQAMVTGFTVNCPESRDTVMTDLREIGPTYYFAPPRIYESLQTQVMIRMEDAGKLKQKMFHSFMAVANKVGVQVLEGKPVGLKDRLLYSLGNLCVFAPLRNVLGLGRIRVAYTAGEAIGPDLFRFYRSLGVNLKQLYGQTETSAYVCLQPDGQVKFDTVGPVAPGMEIKIAENGEVLVRGVSLLKEYYKRPDATAESINADGYFMTGDAGILDKDGHLKIIDRAKDVGHMHDGSMFAPKYIENKLKFFPFIKEAVAFGSDRDAVTAFINIDMDAVSNWAERRGLAYAGYVDLASLPAVYDMMQECVEKVNADLAQDSMVANSQVHRFLVLHKELDPDDDELTRTRKVRRNFVEEKYKVLIDALYSGKEEQFIETKVKFEDGREGSVSATLKIREAKTYPAVVQSAA